MLKICNIVKADTKNPAITTSALNQSTEHYVNASHEEPTTICRTVDPENEPPPSSKCSETVYVHSNIQQNREDSLDGCKKEEIKQITEQVVKDKITSLHEELTNQSVKIVELERKLASQFAAIQFATLDDGWIGLPNRFQYKVLAFRNDYRTSRLRCNEIGADLAVFGVRNITNRRIIKNALKLSFHAWIGMNDIDVEGTWKWINGDLVTDADALWYRGGPSNQTDNDCSHMSHINLRSYDTPCLLHRLPLCEKKWN